MSNVKEMSEKDVREWIRECIKVIPDFIDCRYEEQKYLYDNITGVMKIFNACVTNIVISSKGLDILATRYYAYLLTIYNIESSLYMMCLAYLNEFYDELISTLENNQLFESASNLYKLVNTLTFDITDPSDKN